MLEYSKDGTTWMDITGSVSGTSISYVDTSLTSSATIWMRVIDEAGNSGSVASQVIIIDTTAPAAPTINTVADDNVVNASEQTAVITGTNESGATVAMSLGGNTRAATVSGTSWSYTLTAADITAMGQGAETISVTQTDAAGNTSTAETRAITVDTLAPAAPTIDTVTGDDRINASEQTALITGTNESGATVALSLGGNTRAATVSGTSWSYTLTAADITAMGQGAETLSVTQTDAAGNTSTAATRAITVDTVAPSVGTVAITSATGVQNSLLNAGDVVTATVTFGEAVTVTGTPQLALNIGGTTVQANYASGSGTTSLRFTYTILAGQTDANGISIAADSLRLNAGSILDAAGNAATLTHAAVADNAGYQVDTTPPAAPTIDTVAGDDRINASEQTAVITGTNESGATVALSFSGNTRAATVSGTSWSYTLTAADITAMGQGPETLSVTQTDAAGNTSTAGTRAITVDTTAPSVSTVAITSADGIQASRLNEGDVVTATVTFSEAVTVTGTPQLELTIGDTTDGYTTVLADYASGSGTTSLSFTYTILAGQGDRDGISIAADSLRLNAGSILDAAGNAVTLTHAAVADNSAYMVDTIPPGVPTISTVAGDDVINASEQSAVITGTLRQDGGTVLITLGGNTREASRSGATWSYTLTPDDIAAMGQGTETLSVTHTDGAGNTSAAATRAITVDTLAPSVGAVAITSATGIQNSRLNAGDVVTATVTFGEAVTVTGTPQLALNIGGTTVQANYASGSGTTSLRFTYTILAGQTDANGISIAADSLRLNAGSILDAAGNAATLTHAAVADNSGYLVDTTPPLVPTISTVAVDDVINASEQTAVISGTNESGATVALSLGGNTRAATVSGTSWSYTLTAADITAMGQGAETLSVTQTDAAGNTSTAATRAITVDTTAPAAPTINTVAGDNVINASEQTAVISGTNESGATVALSLGGNTRAATVSGTSWSYTLTAADITAMGRGAETLSVTQTDAAGNTSTAATREITVVITPEIISLAGTVFGGQLIAPVELSGRIYYHWDRDGSGVADTADRESQTQLASRFTGGAPISESTNTVEVNINGQMLTLRLPELGYPAQTEGNKITSGTFLPDNDPAYSGLSDIYDEFNSGSSTAGAPPGWAVDRYWSSTLSITNEHMNLSLLSAFIRSQSDGNVFYVPLEVLFP